MFVSEHSWILCLLFGAVASFIFYLKPNRLPLPPGPKGTLIAGSLRSVPKIHPWLTFTKWKDAYGPIVYTRIFNKHIIILTGAQAVQDLLESRSNIYSDRPSSWMFGELCGRKNSIFWMRYEDPRFKIYRRLLHHGLNPRAIQSYRSIQEEETVILLENLKQSPELFVSHLRRNAGAMIVNITYGHKVTSNDDPLLRLVEEEFNLSETYGRPYMVDLIPWLRFIPDWFPFTNFKKIAKKFRDLGSDSIPYETAKESIKSGHYVESFVSKLLDCENDQNAQLGKEAIGLDMDDIIKWCSAGLYIGGGDTTVSAMTTFFYLMSIHPEIQRTAQEEIERVVGTERVPNLGDRERLPYVTALVKEINRWGPVAPRGLRHHVIQDDEYMGYHIPKGAMVIPNIWGIMHDPEIYPDPFVFDPTRHLGNNPQANPFKYAFGFGRRVCPGQHFAEASLFLNMSNILAAFDIGKARGVDGKEIEPVEDWSSAVTSHLRSFGCSIVPRLRAPWV